MKEDHYEYFGEADTKNYKDILRKISEAAPVAEIQPDRIRETIALLGEAGLLAIVLPGAQLDFNKGNTSGLLKILTDIGKANLSVGRIFEGHINALYLIHLYADEKQKAIWYNEVIVNNYLFAVWNTQEADGIQLVSHQNGICILGYKTFCSGAGVVNRAIVTGTIDLQGRNGWQMSVLNVTDFTETRIDKQSWQPLGMKASGSYKVDFSKVIITEEDLLGTPGIYLRQPYFSAGAIRFAAVQLGGAEAIATETFNYLKNLNRTADPIQRLRLSSIMTQLITGRLWISKAGSCFDAWQHQEKHSEELIAFANMTRVMIEEICLVIMQESNKCVGARGLMLPGILERLHRDLTFYLRQPAPDLTRLNISDFFIQQDDEFGFEI